MGTTRNGANKRTAVHHWERSLSNNKQTPKKGLGGEPPEETLSHLTLTPLHDCVKATSQRGLRKKKEEKKKKKKGM